ncbi:MAG: amino acid kinase family protein [Planctomycetota bacterium]
MSSLDSQPPARPGNLVKAGGSLLSLSDLPTRLRQVLKQLDGPSALIAGGGAAADAVRNWASTFELDEATAHWLAVDSLSLTARLLCDLLNRADTSIAVSEQPLVSPPATRTPAAVIAHTWHDVSVATSHGQIPVLNPRSFLTTLAEENMSAADRSLELPESWDVTSDTIAAAIAVHWNVEQLVLLKSVAMPEFLDDRSQGVPPIDDWFMNVAPRIPCIRWCNLRQIPLRLDDWRQ